MLRKKVALLLVIVLSLSVFIGCSSNTISTPDKADYSYHWKVASCEPADYYMVKLAEKFIQRVNEKTGGKVTGEVFPNGQLGDLMGQLEGLEMGNIDIVLDCFASFSDVNKLFDAFGIAYLYDSKEQQHRFWDTHFNNVADIMVKETGYRPITIIDGLNRQLSSTKPINNLSDLKGMKIRVPAIPVYVRVWELLGTAPVAMSFSEVYTSIQTGVVSGQENDIPLTINSGMYEVAPYCIITDHVPYEAAFFFSDKTYQSFPDELKKIINEVGMEIKEESRAMVKNMEAEALAKLEEMGITVMRPDLSEFKKATSSMWEEYSHCSAILDLVKETR